MDYLYYVLVCLGIMAICLLAVGQPGRRRLKSDQAALSERALRYRARHKQAPKTNREQQRHDHEVIQRELAKVPTPWGWPGHNEAVPHVDHERHFKAEEVHGLSETLHHFVDRLLREKPTVDSEEYLLRKDASLRAMVEDRYGHPVDMTQMRYRKVHPPRLRDPSQPHDQMDNFPSGKTGQIVAGLSGQPRSTDRSGSSPAHRKQTRLKEIKKPWGW